jgi:hypothetical protein
MIRSKKITLTASISSANVIGRVSAACSCPVPLKSLFAVRAFNVELASIKGMDTTAKQWSEGFSGDFGLADPNAVADASHEIYDNSDRRVPK